MVGQGRDMVQQAQKEQKNEGEKAKGTVLHGFSFRFMGLAIRGKFCYTLFVIPVVPTPLDMEGARSDRHEVFV